MNKFVAGDRVLLARQFFGVADNIFHSIFTVEEVRMIGIGVWYDIRSERNKGELVPWIPERELEKVHSHLETREQIDALLDEYKDIIALRDHFQDSQYEEKAKRIEDKINRLLE
ncbi:hypothetical protein [Natribacillus halophilus]|uniref:Uncharacterized protein n=1 Tax=Natribacillus halophilus TaxID=549003 RepID=A0A1G8KWG1_9BACI|nr:hypothetical protein [Natribacillus halophilus]SDI47719.1 hypothetical protein SAMN04488123_102347 [Natribacillus halophilus]